MSIKKISAAVMAAAVLAVAAPAAGIPTLFSVTASAAEFDSNGLQIENGVEVGF